MDRHFGESYYSLKSLFRDEQRKVLNQILISTWQDVETHFRQITDQYTPLMRFLRDINAPLPAALRTAADFTLNRDLQRTIESPDPDPARLRELVEQACARNVELHREELAYAIKNALDQRLVRLREEPNDLALLTRTADLAEVFRSLNLEVNLWKTQNLYFRLRGTSWAACKRLAELGDASAREWIQQFNRLGDHLGFKVCDS
jgi:hypothetical protein